MKASVTAITKNYSQLVDMLSPPSEWAVKFKTKAMISPTSFDRATNEAAFIPKANKAITMLQDIERFIRASNPGIFKTLVSMIHEKEVEMGKYHEAENSLTRKLIDVYKANGGGDEIDSAIQTERNRAQDTEQNPVPFGEQETSRTSVSSSEIDDRDVDKSDVLRPRIPHRSSTQEPQENNSVRPSQPTPPVGRGVLSYPPAPISAILVVGLLIIVGGVVVWVGSSGRSTPPHVDVGVNHPEASEEEVTSSPCGNVEVDYIKNQPLMRVLEESFFPHIAGAWRLVGNSLDIPGHLLDQQQDDLNYQRDKLREVIVYWLKGNGRRPHTLATLANAFDKAAHPLLAQKLLRHPVLCKM